MPFPDAVRAWHSEVYQPVLKVIKEQRVLAAFPGRTPADLYAWVMEHWEMLKKRHGSVFPVSDAANSFAQDNRRPWFLRFLLALTGRAAKPPDPEA